MSNLNFPKMFVLNAANQTILTDNTKWSKDLNVGQVGIFNMATQKGIGSGPYTLAGLSEGIRIHQNVGDNEFGTVRTNIIDLRGFTLKKWYGVKYQAPVQQVQYIGYDEVDNTKTLTGYCGEVYELPIGIFSKIIRKWYGDVGYRKTLLIDTGCCAPCASNCDLVDGQALAQQIADQINGVVPVGEYPAGTELPAFIKATVVSADGAEDDTTVWGVKIETLPNDPCVIPCFDPARQYDGDLVTFTIGTNDGTCDIVWPVTQTQAAVPEIGNYCQIHYMEAESQGYDRQRESFYDVRFNRPGFIFLSQPGINYDTYFLTIERTHDTGIRGSGHAGITEPYIVMMAIATGQGTSIETVMNALVALNNLPAIDMTP